MAQTVSFLSLPTEIRFEIYRIAFSELWSQIVIYLPAVRNPVNLNMLRTCRHIHDELLTFLFSGQVVSTIHSYLPKLVDTINPIVFPVMLSFRCDLTEGLMQLDPLWRALHSGRIKMDMLWLKLDCEDPDRLRYWWNSVLDLTLLAGEENFRKIHPSFGISTYDKDDKQNVDREIGDIEKDWSDAIVRRKKMNIMLPASEIYIRLSTSCSYVTLGKYVLGLHLLKPYKNRLIRITHVNEFSSANQQIEFEWVNTGSVF